MLTNPKATELWQPPWTLGEAFTFLYLSIAWKKKIFTKNINNFHN